MKKWIAMAAAGLAAAGVQAQSAMPAYAELGYAGVSYSENQVPDLKLGLARVVVGASLHPNLAIEGMVGVGVKNDTVRFQGVDVKGKIESVWGIYVKPKINPTPQLELFARLGYADSRVKASAMGFSASDSGSDVSYGVGLAYSFTSTVYLAADYTSYYDKDGIKADGVALAVGFKF